MIGGICGGVIGSRLEFGHKIISPDEMKQIVREFYRSGEWKL